MSDSSSSSAHRLPDYLRNTYSWAYLDHRTMPWLDRPVVVSAILWGNASRLMDAAVGEFSPGQRVLQAAAVYGDFSPRLARRLGDGGQLTVVDVAPIQIANTRRKLAPPVHWLPEAHAFVKATRASLGWGMTPDPLVEDDLATGALVELIANKPVDVPLYWQCWRLNVQALQHVTQAVQRAAALTLLR